MAKSTRKLLINLSEDGFSRLERLKELTDQSSYTAVTDRSYRLYEFFAKASAEGKEIKLVDSEGKETTVELI